MTSSLRRYTTLAHARNRRNIGRNTRMAMIVAIPVAVVVTQILDLHSSVSGQPQHWNMDPILVLRSLSQDGQE